MKVMDGTMDTAEESVPKQKKLKQARLPFQMLTSPVSSNSSTKKRKLPSPSPTSCKSSKVSKLEKRENSKPPEIPEIDITSDKEDPLELSIERSGSPEALSSSRDKKPEPKHSMKPGALTRLFEKVKAAGAPPKPPLVDIQLPVVVLTRCTTESQEKSSEPVSVSAPSSPGKSPKSDDSSHDGLAVIPTSDDEEDDDISKEKSHNSESELSSSSSSEEDKKSHDEDCSKNSSDNPPKTPTGTNSSSELALKKRRLTPKQVEKRLESAKKKEERQRAKTERELQRNEERMKRRKEQEEKRIARKAKEEAEKEVRKREREQKELKKQLEIEQKQKEKERKERAKEEDKKKREEAKEEEKRKKEEERLEAERKKQKAASTFVSFFVPKKLESKGSGEDRERTDEARNFMPFQVRKDMKIAPTCRRRLRKEEKEIIDQCLGEQGRKAALYVEEIKSQGWKPRKSGKTWPADDVDVAKDDVVVIEEDDGVSSIVNVPERLVEKYRAKLLLFKENRRPPYWGTWRKTSLVINPRRPFTKDTKWFDYEIDSDEEWEEEEPGESLRGSDDEKDEENPDDNEYDVDNEFMVPHGYLSDEEAQADEEDEEEMPPEHQKDKLKILEEEFEAEMKTKTAKIKPKVVGCIWQGILNSYPENTPAQIVNFLMARQGWPKETPIALIPPGDSESQDPDNPSKKSIPEEAVPDLIRLVHGNLHGRPFLIKEFLTYWSKNHPGDENAFTKVSVSRKIKELSKRIPCPEEGPMHLKACWYVTEDIRGKYSLEDLRLPNQWIYLLTPKRKTLTEAPVISDKSDKDMREKSRDSEPKKAAPLITMFTKKITQEEMQKQLQVKPLMGKAASPLNRPPKRATLISVPRSDQAPSILAAFSKMSNGRPQVSSGKADEPITISDDENIQSTSGDDAKTGENTGKEISETTVGK